MAGGSDGNAGCKVREGVMSFLCLMVMSRQTSLMKDAVNHIVKSVVHGCDITSSLACDTVVTQRVECTVRA